ncbi:uncharacterized protein J3D65DRAFT_693075, partial [Phyllosticta citribraziliensis]
LQLIEEVQLGVGNLRQVSIQPRNLIDRLQLILEVLVSVRGTGRASALVPLPLLFFFSTIGQARRRGEAGALQLAPNRPWMRWATAAARSCPFIARAIHGVSGLGNIASGGGGGLTRLRNDSGAIVVDRAAAAASNAALRCLSLLLAGLRALLSDMRQDELLCARRPALQRQPAIAADGALHRVVDHAQSAVFTEAARTRRHPGARGRVALVSFFTFHAVGMVW